MMMMKVRHKLILILGIAIVWQMSYWIVQITLSSSPSSSSSPTTTTTTTTTTDSSYEIPSTLLTSTSSNSNSSHNNATTTTTATTNFINADSVVVVNTTTTTSSSTTTTSNSTTNLSVNKNNNEIDDVEHKDEAVIVTKIHGLAVNIEQLLQSLCLLKVAYNNQYNHNYDHIVFTTLPISKKNQLSLKEIVKPANLTIIRDSLPLHNGALTNLTQQQLSTIQQNCNVTSTSIKDLKWDTPCHDGNDISHYPPTSLRYNWQAEFRSRHLWFFNLLQKYKYMIWYDSDAMATQIWPQDHDPIEIMKHNNLTILFERILNDLDGKNKTSIAGKEIQSIIRKSFPNEVSANKQICGIRLKDKHLSIMRYNCDNRKGSFRKIHGFFYIVDLEFYTSTQLLEYYKIYYGDHKFIRYLDDQLAVTIPAALLKPTKSWDMSEHNIKYNILHNGYLDGQKFIKNVDNNGKSTTTRVQQPMIKFLDLIKQRQQNNNNKNINGTSSTRYRVSKEIIDTCQHVITNNG